VSAIRELQHPDFASVFTRLTDGYNTADGLSNQILIRFHGMLLLNFQIV